MQRTERITALSSFFCLSGLLQHGFGLAIDKRVQFGIEKLDTIQMKSGYLHGRYRSRAHLRPDLVREIHRSYLEAGCDAVQTNSFGGSPITLGEFGIADKAFGWVHCTPEKIAEPVIHRLIDMITVGPPPTEHADRYRQGATVTIRTTDGREATNTVFLPYGSAALGIDWADIDAKYHTLMPNSGLPAARIEESLALIRDFAGATGVAELIGLLRA